MEVIIADNQIRIERLELGPYGTNSYVLVCEEKMESVVIDAPGEYTKVLERLKDTTPKYILMTHDHMDHVGGLSDLVTNLKVPVAAHELDTGNLCVRPEIWLHDGEEMAVGNIKLKVMHTPGHTPGSLCFLHKNYLFAGDTIFPGGPGKTGSPKDFREIIRSITQKIFLLPGEIQIYPGHGESAVLDNEKKAFEAFASKSHDPNLCGDVLWSTS